MAGRSGGRTRFTGYHGIFIRLARGLLTVQTVPGSCGTCIGWTLLLAAMAPAGAAPQAPPVRDPVVFSRIDSDHNGYVSRVEARPIAAAGHFNTADENRDGLLDHAEYKLLPGFRQPGTDTVR